MSWHGRMVVFDQDDAKAPEPPLRQSFTESAPPRTLQTPSMFNAPMIFWPLAVGGALALTGLVSVLARRCNVAHVRRFEGPTSRTLLILTGILVVAFTLRLHDIEGRGMSHVEVYVPNIELPDGISEPPPRLDFPAHMAFQWHDEPHPPGYYTFMFPWTRAFGTDLFWLRLPGVIFGTLSVLLLYLLSRQIFDDATALVAAAFLALNGHQVFWSQMARMYAPACLLGLLSTLLLLRLLQGRGGRLTAAGYVFFSLYGLGTQIYFWPLLAGQMLWTLLQRRPAWHTGTLQTVVIMLGTPLWTHAVYRARQSPLDAPSLDFVYEYLAFGFGVEREGGAPDLWRTPPEAILLGGAGLALFALISALWPTRRTALPDGSGTDPAPSEMDTPPRPPIGSLWLLAVGMALVIFGLAWSAQRRFPYLAGSAVLPILCLALPYLHRMVVGWFQDHLPLARYAKGKGLLFCLGIVPAALLFVVSFRVPLLISRGYLLFVPYLLALIAYGLMRLPKALPWISIIAAFAFLVHSTVWHKQCSEANAHGDMVAAMRERFEADDLIFVRPNDWVTTPTFYHLNGDWHRLVTSGWKRVTRQFPDARIWLPTYSDIPPLPGMQAALEDYEVIEDVSAVRTRARLYVRKGGR